MDTEVSSQDFIIGDADGVTGEMIVASCLAGGVDHIWSLPISCLLLTPRKP